MHPHISQEYEAELESVRQRLYEMGHHVDEVLESVGRALSTRDAKLGNKIILGDQEIDAMELEIDNLCLETLARRQPVADDLRLLTSAMKLVIELERIADLGVSVAARVVELASEPPLTGPEDLLRMLTTAREMMTEAMGALETENVERATRAIAKDDVVDGYYTQIFNDVLSLMRENPDNISRATRIQAMSKYIERIGDHATNVAERVIFILTGEEIRHMPRVRRGDLS